MNPLADSWRHDSLLIRYPWESRLEDGLSEQALRLVAAGALLADDLDMRLVPELWGPAARAIFQINTNAVLKGHTGAVRSATFSPDGKRVVTASYDQTARLWDAETGKEMVVLQGHTDAVTRAEFSPDGKRVVTASQDRITLWDISRSDVIVRGRALVLTAALAQGIGWRTPNERQDLLMQDAPDDMFSAAVALPGDRAAALAETVAALHAPLHANCYLSPTEFAVKFTLAAPHKR